MVKVVGFDPIVRKDARVLILGTLPGKLSLDRGEYYAQPRNAFWRIMGELFGAFPDLPYKNRLRLLKARGVAVWDVLRAGYRPGSSDSAIQLSTADLNDFEKFFRTYKRIGLICFNGKKAGRIYGNRVLPELTANTRGQFQCEFLPSTSPANARMTFDQKLSTWSSVLCKETG
jgi:TDG/mug DNA glycosylase family protein